MVGAIREYINQHYPDGDPFADWTEVVLIPQVMENNLPQYRPLLKPEFKPEDYKEENTGMLPIRIQKSIAR